MQNAAVSLIVEKATTTGMAVTCMSGCHFGTGLSDIHHTEIWEPFQKGFITVKSLI